MTIPVKAADVMCASWAPVALAAEPMRRAAIPAAFRIREPQEQQPLSSMAIQIMEAIF